jgi:ethanolamine utilization protein EutQ
MSKAAPRVIAFKDIAFVPRFEHGDVCKIGEVVGRLEVTELGTGFAHMTGARIPWTTSYDEVLTVFEGKLSVHAGDQIHHLGPRDSMWIPSGTKLIYEAEDALVHYAIHPVSAAS